MLFNGVAAPLLYVGSQQINAIVPVEAANSQTTTVKVLTPSGTIGGPTLRVRASQPAVFGRPYAEGTWYFAAALNQDGTVNSQAHPAPPGSIVTVWATGAGLTTPYYQDGAILGPGGPSYLFATANVSIPLPVSVLGGNDSVQVLYANAAPDAVQGVVQINFVTTGGDTFRLQIGSAISEPFSIWIPGLYISP